MLNALRQTIVQQLWQNYFQQNLQMQIIAKKLSSIGIHNLYLDHFAVIDLPGIKTGRYILQSLFEAIGYELRGEDYLPDKQNDFAWLAVSGCERGLAKETLPQVVVADFRLEEMPPAIHAIISKYGDLADTSPLKKIQSIIQQNNLNSIATITAIFNNYFAGRAWPLVTVKEFKTVHEFNELLAWVLVFGRRPNHFTLSIHLLNYFKDLNAFSKFVTHEANLKLNVDGGIIKGDHLTGIAQGSTLGTTETVQLADGTVQLPLGFVEFVWRYPTQQKKDASLTCSAQSCWGDFFTGFVANHANRVIESLYTEKR